VLYAAKTQSLWKDDWFYDFDTRRGQLVTTVGKDLAQVAPIFCRLADAGQIEKMRPALRTFFTESRTRHLAPEDDWRDPLHWSSLVLPYLESLWAAGEMEALSRVVEDIAERIYSSMDRRSLTSVSGADGEAQSRADRLKKLGWPGVSCEIWGSEGAYGGEGYGWGAVLPAHIIRNLVGYRDPEGADELRLAPNLPESFMTAGRRYRVRNLDYRGEKLALGIRVLDGQRVEVEGVWAGPLDTVSVKDAAQRRLPVEGTGSEWQFEARNRQQYVVQIAPPTNRGGGTDRDKRTA
jgi:hypothetical protein